MAQKTFILFLFFGDFFILIFSPFFCVLFSKQFRGLYEQNPSAEFL